MKRLLLIAVFMIAVTSLQAQPLRDVIYLKNGSVIRGIITEQVVGESFTIQTGDGNVFTFRSVEVDKIVKEQSDVRQLPVIKEGVYMPQIESVVEKPIDDSRFVSGRFTPRKRGYYGMAEVTHYSAFPTTGVTMVNGGKVNEYLAIGGGFGIFIDNSPASYSGVSFFQHTRVNFSKKPITPFVTNNLGFLLLSGYIGTFIEPSVGVSFRISNGASVNLSVGACIGSESNITKSYLDPDTERWIEKDFSNGLGSLVLKAGLNF